MPRIEPGAAECEARMLSIVLCDPPPYDIMFDCLLSVLAFIKLLDQDGPFELDHQ